MFQNRINFNGDLTQIFQKASIAYNLGQLINFSIIETGYEDFNVKVQTTRGYYLAKVFSKFRTNEEIERLIDILVKVMENNISAPKLHKNKDGFLYIDQGISMVMFDFIDGKTFYETNIPPAGNDLREIIFQASEINKIKFDELPYQSDAWNVQNINTTFDEIKTYITDKRARAFITHAIDRWNQIPLDQLPKSFVHGDIITTNVIKGSDDKIYIIDFSVANIYPRIQEIAVIVSNLVSGNGKSLMNNAKIVWDIYNQFVPLTDIEKQHFESFVLAETATIYMGAIREKFINNNDSPETDYWINLCYNDMTSYLCDNDQK